MSGERPAGRACARETTPDWYLLAGRKGGGIRWRIRQRQREISRSTANVENARFRLSQNVGKASGKTFPPHHVKAQG